MDFRSHRRLEEWICWLTPLSGVLTFHHWHREDQVHRLWSVVCGLRPSTTTDHQSFIHRPSIDRAPLILQHPQITSFSALIQQATSSLTSAPTSLQGFHCNLSNCLPGASTLLLFSPRCSVNPPGLNTKLSRHTVPTWFYGSSSNQPISGSIFG